MFLDTAGDVAPELEGPIDISGAELKVGKFIFMQDFPVYFERILFPLIDVGDDRPRAIATALGKHYKKEELEHKLCVVLTNSKRISVYGVATEGLLLCACSKDKREYLVPPAGALPGDPVTVARYPAPTDLVEIPKISDNRFDYVVEEMKVRDDGVVVYRKEPLEVQGKGSITVPTLRNCMVDYPIKR